MDAQNQETLRLLLRLAAAALSLALFAIALWALEALGGVEADNAYTLAILFVAIFGGAAAVRPIGDALIGHRNHRDEERITTRTHRDGGEEDSDG